MTLPPFVKQGQKFAIDNSPAILTGIGVAGVVTTAYLTGRASIKALEILQDHDEFTAIANPRGTRKTVELVWKEYIPPVSMGALTIICIIGANRIGSRRTAAMAAAYSISERAYTEYKEKVLETVGKQKEEKIRAAVQQDRLDKNPPEDDDYLNAAGGDVKCKDAWSGRYFKSDMETIKSAQNAINHVVNNHGYASLTDFYSHLGLEGTKESDNVGWNSDKLMEVFFTSIIDDKRKPVLVMDFAVAPARNFFRAHG